MPTPTDVITVRGPLFTKRIDKTVEQAIIKEAMDKFGERVRRKGRKIGRKRNPIGEGKLTKGRGEVKLELETSLNYPRTTGRSWQRKNIAAVKAMRGRVLRKLAKRIVGELS